MKSRRSGRVAVGRVRSLMRGGLRLAPSSATNATGLQPAKSAKPCLERRLPFFRQHTREEADATMRLKFAVLAAAPALLLGAAIPRGAAKEDPTNNLRLV